MWTIYLNWTVTSTAGKPNTVILTQRLQGIIGKQKEEELLPSQLAKAWNSLPLPLRQRDSVDSFKKALWNEFLQNSRLLIFFFLSCSSSCD